MTFKANSFISNLWFIFDTGLVALMVYIINADILPFSPRQFVTS